MQSQNTDTPDNTAHTNQLKRNYLHEKDLARRTGVITEKFTQAKNALTAAGIDPSTVGVIHCHSAMYPRGRPRIHSRESLKPDHNMMSSNSDSSMASGSNSIGSSST